MKTLLTCISIFASLMLSAAPRILFDLSNNAKLVRSEITLNRSDDGTLRVTKSSHAQWGGVFLPKISTHDLAGKEIRVSGRIQVKSLNSFGLKQPLLLGSLWFQNDKWGIASNKKRIGSGKFFSLKEAGPEIAFDKTFPVPQNGKYMVIFLNFGYATGEFVVKDLKVEAVGPVKVEKRVNAGIPEIVMLLQPGIPKSFSLANPADGKKAADITLSYTPQGVDLRVEANDSHHRQPFSDERIWRGDSLQFAADPLLDRQGKGYNGGDDVEYGVALLKNGKSLLHIFAAPSDYPPPMSRIRYSVKRDEASKRTEYKLYLPWKAFGPFQYDKMDRFGANILLNASEENGKRTPVEWRPATAMGKKPSAMAAILLDKTKRGIMADILPCKVDRNSGEKYCFQAAVAAVKPVKGKISITCNGKQVYDENTDFARGETIFTFTLPNLLFKNGDNTISIAFSDAKEVFYTKSFKVSQLSVEERIAQIEKLLKICHDKMAAVTPMILKFNIDAAFPREQMISWKVCKLFLDWFIPEDITRKDYVLALREVKEVDAALTQLQKELENKNYVLSKSRNVMDLKIDSGSLVGSDGPVFAFGIHGYGEQDEMRRMNWQDYKMLSTTYSSYTLPMVYWTVFPKTQDGKLVNCSKKLKSLPWRKNNITGTPLIQASGWWTKKIKEWQPDAIVSGNHYLDFDPDHPKMREMLDIMVSGAFRDLAAQKHTILKDALSFDLWNEPMLGSVSPYTVVEFRKFLKKRYGTIEKYNRHYKSKFKSFDEITDVRGPMDYFPIAGYDYCTFNEQRFYEFHKIVRDAARRGAGPENPIRFSIKLMNAQLCGIYSSAERGYDVDLISQLTDIHSGDNSISVLSGTDYNCSWRQQAFTFDLMKSVAPNQPIVDGEYHASAASPDNASAAFLMGAHHGLNAASWWRWNRDEKMYFRMSAKGAMPYWFRSSPDGNPAAMIAGLRTAVLLDRLMEEVQPFYTAPRPIRLFWSQTSINFIGTNCIHTLWKAYDKLHFFSHQHLGFLTEHKLLEGKIPEDMKILVIAGTPYAQSGVWQALEKLEKAGVRVVRIGENQITRNSFDEKMEPPRLKHPAESSLDAWDIRKDMQSAGVTELARMVGENRQFVEARFVKYGNRVLGYAVNLGRKKAKLHVTDLQGKTLSIKTRGEISVRTMKEFDLEPREWILFEL